MDRIAACTDPCPSVLADGSSTCAPPTAQSCRYMNLLAAGTGHPFCLRTAADFLPDHASRFCPTLPNTLVSSPMMLAGTGVPIWPDGPPAAVFSPVRFADDLLTVAKVVSEKAGTPPHFVGHSLGAGTGLWALTRTYSNPFATVTLFEPNVFPSLASPERAEAEQKHRRLIHMARLRRAEWTNPAELAQKLMRGFAGFSENAALIHAHATLYRLDEYRWRLCCPPAIEAVIFENHQDDQLWKLLPTIAQRVVLISADPSRPDREWVTSCMQSVASLLSYCEVRVIPNSTHLLVMTLPRETAEIVLRQLMPPELPAGRCVSADGKQSWH